MNITRAKTLVLRLVRRANAICMKVGWGVVLGGILFVILFLAWQQASQQTRTNFEGTIVERFAAYAETEEGSRPGFSLMIESENHERFKVKVGPGVYESAKIGMRIRSKSGKIELVDSPSKKY